MDIRKSHFETGPSLSRLLYAYIWPFWLFENVHGGSLFECAAAYRRNRLKRVYLPGYAVKWFVVFGLFTQLLFALEALGHTNSAWAYSFTLLACGAGLLATLSLVVVAMIVAMYLLLTCWEY
jgi:hypothetical protein